MIDGLARLFFMHGDAPPEDKTGPKVESHTLITQTQGRKRKSKQKRKIKSPILQYNKWEPPPILMGHGRESPVSQRAVNSQQSPETPCALLHSLSIEHEVKEINRALKAFMLKSLTKDATARTMREWRFVALVVDRLFFFIYVVTIFVSLFTMLPK